MTIGQILKVLLPYSWQQRLMKSLMTPDERRFLSFSRNVQYFQDGLATIHNSDFIDEPRFTNAYQRGYETGSWGNYQIQWRAHVACWAAAIGASLEGDFVECGVNRGGLARTVAEYVNFKTLNKTFYLLDTYEGLVESLLLESEKTRGLKGGMYEPAYEAIQKTFADYPNVQIVKGIVPDTLTQVISDKVAYLSIDMNSRVPEIAAATYFWGKMSVGAIMVLDDYGFALHIDQKHGFDEFARERNVPILSLPTGQGIIIKP